MLAPGYYPNLARYPFHNRARGGLERMEQGRYGASCTSELLVLSVWSVASFALAMQLFRWR